MAPIAAIVESPYETSGGKEAAAANGLNGAATESLPCVLGIGTANPEQVISTDMFVDDFTQILERTPRITELSHKIAKTCGISSRHCAVYKDEYLAAPAMKEHGGNSLNERVKLYTEHGVPLGARACEVALADWGGDRKDITHLLTFSTSGMICPGLDLRLIKILGLQQSTKHMFISYMGCHAGLIGLRTAAEIARADPSHRVMIVASEINSLNAQAPDPEHPVNNIIVNTIFGDGASAIIVGAAPTKDEAAIYEIHRSATSYIPDCDEDITARVTCQGLDVGLSRNVPNLVAGAVDPFVRELVGGLDYEKDLLWAVHPGGKAIVDSTQKGCRLTPEKLQVSRYILDKYANMAAATVLFVLNQVRIDNAAREGKHWVVALAFGPGISVEGSLLRLIGN